MSWSPYPGGPVYSSAPSGKISQDIRSTGSANSAATVSSGTSLPSGVSSYMQQVADITGANNVWSAKQAEIQRDWQVQQNQIAMNFNAQEAAKNRDWQKMMSDTAHQREVKDLIAAGLNPVLSALNGNGAAVTSGATASGVTSAGAKGDTDTSGSGALASLLASFLSAQTRLQEMNTNAITNLAVADKYTEMSRYTAELGAQTQLTTANIAAAASRYASDNSAAASQIAASIHAAAQKYGYDVSAMTQKEIAAFNAEVNKELSRQGYEQDFSLKEAFPSNPWQAVGSVNSMLGDPVGSIGDALHSLFGVKQFDGFSGSGSSAKSFSGSGSRSGFNK